MTAARFVAYPPIEAYGDGGFRIEGRRVEGSILILNGEVSPWEPRALGEVGPEAFDAVFASEPRAEFVLFGVGARLAHPGPAVKARFRDAAFGLEFMDTGAACRAYLTLVGQGRRLAAALIAV